MEGSASPPEGSLGRKTQASPLTFNSGRFVRNHPPPPPRPPGGGKNAAAQVRQVKQQPFGIMHRLLALCSLAQALQLLPLSGTFLDVAYDGRLKYANSATPHFSCADWGLKLREMHDLGMRLIIFQAVHDARFGAYYTSSLPFMAPWPGLCADVVEAVLAAADALPGMRVLLSAEYYGTEADPVANSTVMQGRLAIMEELARTRIPPHASFLGWYFSAEAYLTPYFVDGFFDYVGNLSAAARRLTPQALIFISPYNTRLAVADAAFALQLQRLGALGVSAIAYQDEVGCVRDELPIATACAAWQTLRAAHDLAGPSAPSLWANVESFTWEAAPNNSSSALIPTALPRLLAQLRCASAARVERIVTFTVEAMLEAPRSPAPWGPPDALRLRAEYAAAALQAPAPPAALLLAAIVQGAVAHEGVGAAIAALAPAPLPPGRGGGGAPAALTDGLTGPEDPFSPAWVAFPLRGPAAGQCSEAVELVLDLGSPRCFAALGLHALQVPAAWWQDGSGARRVQRNVSAALPGSAAFAVSNASAQGPWAAAATAPRPAPYAQELYDLRADVLAAATGPQCARFVRAALTPGPAPQGALPWPDCPLLLISEVFVLQGPFQ